MVKAFSEYSNYLTPGNGDGSRYHPAQALRVPGKSAWAYLPLYDFAGGSQRRVTREDMVEWKWPFQFKPSKSIALHKTAAREHLRYIDRGVWELRTRPAPGLTDPEYHAMKLYDLWAMLTTEEAGYNKWLSSDDLVFLGNLIIQGYTDREGLPAFVFEAALEPQTTLASGPRTQHRFFVLFDHVRGNHWAGIVYDALAKRAF